MKISLAQIHPEKGNIDRNIEIHQHWIEEAVAEKADFVAFSELSLTGYEPALAEGMAMQRNDPRLTQFQELSDQDAISIGIGLPLRSEHGIYISMMIFRPNLPPAVYSKQQLHDDEKPFFIEGREQLIVSIESKKFAPAICYESLQATHSENASRLGAEIYLASVAKNEGGMEKALSHYPKVATRHSMPVLMSNCIGFCDNFLSAGQSAVWDEKGHLVSMLKQDEAGLLTFDTETGRATMR